jgi:hypothetical protein
MADPTAPAVGDVWRYPFLWSREAAGGETEGRKLRPVALALVTRTDAGETEVLMVPITSRPPVPGRFALEVPDIEKRRAGLDPDLRLWVITDEANRDLPGRSFHFEPEGRVGAFSPRFTKAVQARMIEAVRARKLNRVSRR